MTAKPLTQAEIDAWLLDRADLRLRIARDPLGAGPDVSYPEPRWHATVEAARKEHKTMTTWTDEQVDDFCGRDGALYEYILGLRADLARVTGERDRLKGLLDAKDAHVRDLAEQLIELRNDLIDEQAKEIARLRRERDEAREERDRLAAIACPNCGAPNDATAEARGRILARIRAEAGAEALERAAQAAFRVADEEMEVANQCYQACQIRDGDARMERASAASDVAFAIRALANGKDGDR